MLALFAHGWIEVDDFTGRLSDIAIAELEGSRSDKSNVWPAQWLIGLTGKLADNVLRGKQEERKPYIDAFEAAVRESADRCRKDVGELEMTLGFVENGRETRPLNWYEITRLTTALGCAALTIRGSDKSMYGKLFERLILGSVLSILGFHMVPRSQLGRMIFWLSDKSANREYDATAMLEPGRVARFDIGFIGAGNPEITKDKLSRFELEMEVSGTACTSRSFIVVDRLPKTQKTITSAERAASDIIQMSMKYWPKDLAQAMKKCYPGFSHPLVSMPENRIGSYLEGAIAPLSVQDYLAGLSLREVPEDDLADASEEVSATAAEAKTKKRK